MSVSLNELCQDFLAFEKILKFISLPTFSKLSLVSSMRVRHDIGGSISVSKLDEKSV